jgi:hypothetical protein
MTDIPIELQPDRSHQWGKKEVALPVSAIDSVGQDTVWLKIDKKAVGALPAVPVKRHSD